MATINTKMVQGRYRVAFDNIRKTCGQLLGPIREFFTRIGEKKKTDAGMRTTCDQIEGLFPEFYQNVSSLRKQHDELKELCSQSAFEGVDITKHEKRVEFSRKLDQLFKYVEHFQNKIRNQSVRDAADSVVKHRAQVIASIDAAKKLNVEVATAAVAWVNSERFATLAKSDECYVAIRKSEIVGTKKEIEEYLAKRDPSMLEELKKGHKKQRRFIANDNSIVNDGEADDEADDDEEFDDAALDDDEAAEEALARQFDKPDEDVEVNEDDDDSESAEYDEEYGARRRTEGGDKDDDGTGDESGEMSHGAVLFESNIERNNAHVIAEVEANSIVRNGRTLRQRKYEKLDMNEFGHLFEKNQVEDNRESRVKRKRAAVDEEADGSEMSESSESSALDAAMFGKVAELAAQRERDAQPDAAVAQTEE